MLYTVLSTLSLQHLLTLLGIFFFIFLFLVFVYKSLSDEQENFENKFPIEKL